MWIGWVYLAFMSLKYSHKNKNTWNPVVKFVHDEFAAETRGKVQLHK